MTRVRMPATALEGVENFLQVRENTYSVGVYFNDPYGNGIEVYYEEPGGYRRAWEGQYARKLEEVTA